MARHMMKASLAVAAIALLITVSAKPAQAGTTSTSADMLVIGPNSLLSDLIDNDGTILVGDKRFGDFSYFRTGNMPDPDRVNVVGIQDADGHFGIRFEGAFLDLPGNGASDAQLEYSVHATLPGYEIVDVHLHGNPNVVDRGLAKVTESFPEPSVMLQGGRPNIEIFNQQPSPPSPTPKVFDWADFTTSHERLLVNKNIVAFATGSGNATVTIIDQTFSQIPEPASAGLLMMGAALAAVCYRPRSRRRQ